MIFFCFLWSTNFLALNAFLEDDFLVFKIKLKELRKVLEGRYSGSQEKRAGISKKNKALESTYYTFRTVKTVHVLLLVFIENAFRDWLVLW